LNGDIIKWARRSQEGQGKNQNTFQKVEDARRELSAVPTEQMQALELKHQAEKVDDNALYDCERGGRGGK